MGDFGAWIASEERGVYLLCRRVLQDAGEADCELDPVIPLLSVRTLEHDVNENILVERLVATLSGFFGLLALLLSAVGYWAQLCLPALFPLAARPELILPQRYGVNELSRKVLLPLYWFPRFCPEELANLLQEFGDLPGPLRGAGRKLSYTLYSTSIQLHSDHSKVDNRMSGEEKIARHYTRERLKETILEAVKQTARDRDHLTAGDFAAMDEFHVGGLEATRQLAAQMELHPDSRVLDVGCGIGGPARYFAEEHGCSVTGIDLTEEFVDLAKSLTRFVDLDRLVQFQQASALSLPFEPEMFDRAYMIHAGMNIADKAGVCREVRRVMKPGGLFAVFDIVRTSDGALRYPLPWALDEETDFVAGLNVYRDALAGAGFSIRQERSRKLFAIEFTQRAIARMAQSGPPLLGLQLLMGEHTRAMIANVLALFEECVLDPVELIAQAV